MAKTVRRPAADKASRPAKADRKVAKAAGPKGLKAKPPRGKPARGKAPAFPKAKPGFPKAKGFPAKAKGAFPAKGKKRRDEERSVTDVPKGPGGATKRKVLEPRAPADAAAAAPRAEAAGRPDPSRPRAMAVAQAGLDKKAEDVLVLDVRGLTSYADYFVLMTADSDRQAGAIADSVDDRMKQLGSTRVGSEGYESGRWILIDYGDVVAHVMSREARGFYDLEGLWADAPRFEVAG